MAHGTSTHGTLLRTWRQRRRFSQLDLANAADVSPRHVSFIETGRARPSREMVLRLCEHLDVPLRDRNQLLLAAGYAPVFGESRLHSPGMLAVREALRRLLDGHSPNPAAVVDGWWNLVEANATLQHLVSSASDDLLRPPVNVLRLSLHPEGLAPRILNLGQWRGHLLARLRRQVAVSADAELADLLRELAAYPGGDEEVHVPGPEDVVLPLRLRVDGPQGPVQLSLLSTVATFGTPLDVTVAELVIESFFPADQPSAELLQALGA